MARRKTAIAVPEDVLEEVERAARERGESRSRFISATPPSVLAAYENASTRRAVGGSG